MGRSSKLSESSMNSCKKSPFPNNTKFLMAWRACRIESFILCFFITILHFKVIDSRAVPNKLQISLFLFPIPVLGVHRSSFITFSFTSLPSLNLRAFLRDIKGNAVGSTLKGSSSSGSLCPDFKFLDLSRDLLLMVKLLLAGAWKWGSGSLERKCVSGENSSSGARKWEKRRRSCSAR